MSTPNTHYGYKYINQILENCRSKTVFFSGAGGIMMSSLALITKRRGFEVKGSDRARTNLTEKLENEGITVYYQHDAQNLGDNCGLLVYTVAISEDNPEYVYAKEHGITCVSRADYLGYIMMAYENRIGIAGMHGKSTCTSMCAEIFMDRAKRCNDLMPTVVSGAEYKPMNGAYYLGGEEDFIFEACEYMDSFLDFNPSIAVLLNIEMEHVDYFKSVEQIIKSFTKFAEITGEDGTVIANYDDDNIMSAVEDYQGRLITFGLDEEADFCATNICVEKGKYEFDILRNKSQYIHVTLPVFGKHNIYNALAACAAAYICGISKSDILYGLEHFSGAVRRMEFKGELNGADVYDDYGHHPTEVKATLDGVRNVIGTERRLVCAFQPHTYSRTAALIDEFSRAFVSADAVLLTDIYAARENNEYGISSEKLANVIGHKAKYAGDIQKLSSEIREIVRPGDMVVIMGAGDIYKVFNALGL